MTFTVTVMPSGKQFAVEPDETVLEAVEAMMPEPKREPAPVAPAPAAPVAAAQAEPEPVVEEEDFFDDYPEPDEVEAPEDPAAIFARLREAARKHGESD